MEDETKYGKPEKMSYCDCIHKMLVSESERFVADLGRVMTFRARLKEMNVTVATFMKQIRWIYSQFSFEAAHKIYHVPILKHYEVEKIEEMLDCAGVKDIPTGVKVFQK